MRLPRYLLLAVTIALAACAAEEPAPEPEPEPAAEAPMDDEAAIDALRASYVEHYNMHHPDVVAAMYAEDGVTLLADGSARMGREAIAAGLAEDVAANPTATINADEIMVMGDNAAMIGNYGLELAPAEGETMSVSGHFMTIFRKQDDEWKIRAVISNYGAPPPPGTPGAGPPEEDPELLADNPLADLTSSYMEHFNMGHASVVAELYTEDAVAGFADSPINRGRAAIEAALEQRMAQGNPQLTIHTVGAEDLGDGWMVGGGWYEIVATTDDGEAHQRGNWMTLVRTEADGSHKIHRAITNALHPGDGGM